MKIVTAKLDSPLLAKECDDWHHSSELVPCNYGDGAAANTVVLIGDSVGAQWLPAIQKIFEKQDWRLVVLTKSACPMVDEPVFYARIGRRYTECEIWRTKALAYIAQVRPRIVIAGSASSYAFSVQQWESGMDRMWKSLSLAADKVYVVRATPTLPFDALDCLASGSLAQRLLNFCTTSRPFSSGDDIFSMQQRIAAGFNNVWLIDMIGNICPDGVCRAEVNGMIAWRDERHLTAKFAASLSKVFLERMQEGGGGEE